MAYLPESSSFDEGVYQLETTDPVVGGPSGVSNAPLKNLANRTLWLKNAISSLVSSLSDIYAPKTNPNFSGNPTAPTPAQFDNDNSIATTEFVQTALGSLRGGAVVTESTTLSALHVGKAIQVSGAGPYTLTMPLAANLPDGAMIQFNLSASGVITIQRQGSDLIYPNMGTGVTSFKLAAGDSAVLIKLNGVWGLLGGSAALRAASGDFGSLVTGNGYQKLPSGLIIQWGKWWTSYTAGEGVAVSFPVAFTTACFAINTTPVLSSAQNYGAWVDNMQSSTPGGQGDGTSVLAGFTARSAAAYISCRYIAIGY